MFLRGHFIDSVAGRCFATQVGEFSSKRAILCLPSLFEELNLARAVVAKQAQAFADQGLPCLILDYYGTGDSEGEFEQASVDIWRQDITAAISWLKAQGVDSILLWGMRFGALMAMNQQMELHEQITIEAQIFWKPVVSGKQFAGQLLRIKQAHTVLNNAAEKINWRQHILDGNTTEIAGYPISSELLTALEALEELKASTPLSPVYWFELGAKSLTPASERIIAQWSERKINSYSVDCPPFWQVPEVFSLPELASQNMHALTVDGLL